MMLKLRAAAVGECVAHGDVGKRDSIRPKVRRHPADYDPDSPGNMSILELSTIASEMPMMGVFNNLIMFDQHRPQVASIRSCPILPPGGRGTRTAPG